jgi:hypothetical protein
VRYIHVFVRSGREVLISFRISKKDMGAAVYAALCLVLIHRLSNILPTPAKIRLNPLSNQTFYTGMHIAIPRETQKHAQRSRKYVRTI